MATAMMTPEQYMHVIDEVRDRFVRLLRERPELMDAGSWRDLQSAFAGIGHARPSNAQRRTAFTEAKKIVRKEFLKYSLT